jgi:AmmeMemoRadiSam system protein A
MSGLDEHTSKRLLQIARSAISAEVAGATSAPSEADPDLPGRGVFITLRKFGDLRGCIGTFTPQGNLSDTVRAMAASAAHDPRFVQMPIREAELGDITIEVSVLSPLQPIANPLELEAGVHGIYVRRGVQSGCFLPDVATERAWDAETFLSICCEQKAGLEPDAWRTPGTEVFVFTVEKFSDFSN